MKDAIQKAIEGGYEYEGLKCVCYDRTCNFCIGYYDEHYALIRENPVFWDGLTRSLRLADVLVIEYPSVKVLNELERTTITKVIHKEKIIPAWKYYWHSLIDHLAEGRNVDYFFKKLLNNK